MTTSVSMSPSRHEDISIENRGEGGKAFYYKHFEVELYVEEHGEWYWVIDRECAREDYLTVQECINNALAYVDKITPF